MKKSSRFKSSIISVGIIGLGRTGWGNHANTLKNMLDRYKVASVCDADDARLAEARALFGCKTCKSADQLIGDPDVDVVVVATPTPFHEPQTLQVLAAGKVVICEKPMATNLPSAQRMLKAAEKSNGILTVFQNNRYAPDFEKVREVIQSGKLGRVVEIRQYWNSFGRRWDWQTLQKFGGGTLNNTGPHPMDQLLQLLGPDEPEITCHMDRALTLGDADDHVKIVLRLPGKMVIDLELSSADAYAPPRWSVLGTRGSLTGSASQLNWKYFNEGDLPERKVEESAPPDRRYNSETIPWKEESWTLPEGGPTTPQKYYESLHRRLLAGESPEITAAEAVRVVAVTHRCHELGEKGWSHATKASTGKKPNKKSLVSK